MNGSPSVKVAQFNRDSGSKSPCRWFWCLRIYMGLSAEHKLILHIGGVYGEKEKAIERFCRNYEQLPEQVRERLVIENDERCYHIRDVYDIGTRMKIPVVFDNLHHQLNLPRKPEKEAYWLQMCQETWEQKDGPQKIHYAQQAEGKRPGAHSWAIRMEEFMDFIGGFPFDRTDIMLEVKNKNQSAITCMNYTRSDHNIRFLEKEWECYRFDVLSHSRKIYWQIEALLRDKNSYPVDAFYQLVSQALELADDREEQLNAMDHIWQYVKDAAEEREKRLFLRNIETFRLGDISEAVICRQLYRLACKYHLDNLLYSYYFSVVSIIFRKFNSCRLVDLR